MKVVDVVELCRRKQKLEFRKIKNKKLAPGGIWQRASSTPSTADACMTTWITLLFSEESFSARGDSVVVDALLESDLDKRPNIIMKLNLCYYTTIFNYEECTDVSESF